MRHKVYFIESGNYIKIGYTTKSLKSSLSILQVGNPIRMNILGSISCDCHLKYPPTLGNQPTCKKKSELHAQFLHLQVKNVKKECEWFEGTAELRDYIDKHADEYVDY